MCYRSGRPQKVKGKVGVAAPGCSLSSVTAMWTGASGAYERKGLMWRCRSLCFQGTTSTFTFPVLYSHTHADRANWHAHTVGQMYRSAFIVISTIVCTYTQPERYRCIFWQWISGYVKCSESCVHSRTVSDKKKIFLLTIVPLHAAWAYFQIQKIYVFL